MHIPDGYLGPTTCIAGWAVMLPVLAVASRKVSKTLEAKQVPLIAIGAAFCFVIMLFNIPIPGGTTGHATGAVLAAILLGPWAACIAVSVALFIQAMLFGDGGITALGANCFNMAFIMPFAGYAVYRLISGTTAATSPRRVIAAGVGGYAGLVFASAAAGVEFGLQPLLHHTASGQALYCPYGLSVTVPAMVSEHLLLFGWFEFAATALVVKFLQVKEPSLLSAGRSSKPSHALLWAALLTLVVLSPLGIILPAWLHAGNAWGEWSARTLTGLVGYLPHGLRHYAGFWKAPFPDYGFSNVAASSLRQLSVNYVIAAAIGVTACIVAATALGILLRRRNGKSASFPERFIFAMVVSLKQTVAGDEIAVKNGYLQHRDPRFKTLALLLVMLAVLVTKSPLLIALTYAGCLLCVNRSSISLPFFFKRTLPFVPLFSAVIALPALFSVFSPGEPVFAFKLFQFPMAITRQGVGFVTIFTLRVLVSVSLAVLVILTTRHQELLKALRSFGVPKLFVMTLGMCYRYIFLLLDIIQNIFIAIKSRVGAIASGASGRRVVTASMAGLWLHSYRMQTQVYSAMLARGYTGEPRLLSRFRAHAGDYAMVTISFILFAGALWLNRYFH